ncbi:DMT family transporter [Ruegeria sp. R14_0]|uniref:DMT family transporter n=1 Tax=Ruegeria sp. R14_0 TaxID=2821100 RepID=UPI001AD9C4D2|nr:DMT family transporter [Ruegeria sp. R14_0]MBO9447374.1 DMT family transporter [Ruegeria sp. R14_0]
MPDIVRRSPVSALIMAIGVLVGVSFTLSKFVSMAGISALTALFWQVLLASIALLALSLLLKTRVALNTRHIPYYIGAGVFGVSGPALIGLLVLEHVSLGFYSALVTLSPLFTFAITALITRKMLPLHRLVGILIGLAGVSLATMGGFDLSGVEPAWIALSLLGPLFLASGNVFRSYAYPPGGDPLGLATGTLLSQLLLIIAPLLGRGSTISDVSVPPALLGAIFGIGFITALSYVLTFEVQRRTDGVGFAQVGYFATLSGIAIGAVVFREPLGLGLLGSLAILFLGLAVTNGHLKLPPVLHRRSQVNQT